MVLPEFLSVYTHRDKGSDKPWLLLFGQDLSMGG